MTSAMDQAQCAPQPDPRLGREHGRSRGGKFLAFFLAGEEYGLEILKVQEIIRMMPVTTVPQTKQHAMGVINLRGKVIPIVDLRLKLAMPRAAQTDQSCIIVVQTNATQIGIVVDKVSEVIDIAEEYIEDAPSFGSDVNSDFILGVGKSEGKVKLLLDIDKVLADQPAVANESAAVVRADDDCPEFEIAA